MPWREGGWTRKQIVGHLLDSAANNRQRFVRASTDGKYKGPKYSQDAWVAAHGYSEQTWETTAELVGGGTRDSDRGCGSHSRGPASDKLHRGWRGTGDAAVSDRRLCEPSAVALEAADWPELEAERIDSADRCSDAKKPGANAGLFCLPLNYGCLVTSSWQLFLAGFFATAFFAAFLAGAFFAAAFLAGAFFAAFLTANFLPRFVVLPARLPPQPSWLRPFRP